MVISESSFDFAWKTDARPTVEVHTLSGEETKVRLADPEGGAITLLLNPATLAELVEKTEGLSRSCAVEKRPEAASVEAELRGRWNAWIKARSREGLEMDAAETTAGLVAICNLFGLQPEDLGISRCGCGCGKINGPTMKTIRVLTSIVLVLIHENLERPPASGRDDETEGAGDAGDPGDLRGCYIEPAAGCMAS